MRSPVPTNAEWWIPGDEWAVRVLKVKGEIYLTDWSYWVDFDDWEGYPEPDLEVKKLLPNGCQVKVGVLGDTGIFDVIDDQHGWPLEIVEVAGWQDIELLPEWGSE